MRNISKFISILTLAMLMAGLGCVNRQVRTARAMQTIDTAPSQSAKGYVEFFSVSKEAVVPVYYMDDQRRAHLLGATGLRKGDSYSFQRHRTSVSEKLRVAVPPGSQTFMIERDGVIVRVPVEAVKVTPVQVDYVLIYSGLSFVVCNVKADVLKPGSLD